MVSWKNCNHLLPKLASQTDTKRAGQIRTIRGKKVPDWTRPLNS
jgi:hypothetical protein